MSIMIINTAVTLTMAVACLAAIATIPAAHAAARRTVVVKHPPIVSPGDESESWDARQNVIDSKRCEQLLRTNPAFREARMRKECGSITDPQLHQSCIASFDRYGPSVGSSNPPRQHHSNPGR
jgi:hypothetical protein